MRQFFVVLCLLVNTAACSIRATPTPDPAARVPEPTPTSPIASPDQALSNPDWAGAIAHADGTTESILVHLTDDGGALTLQPHTAKLSIVDVQREGATLSFTVTGKTEMRFSGEFDGTRLAGEAEQNGQTDSFVLLPLFTQADDLLADFVGTYRFSPGEALTIGLSPSFTRSGLDFFSAGLTLTHFGTGAIRGLYPVAQDAFLVGSARVLGYPFAAQITFLRDDLGNVTGLMWQPRDPADGRLGAAQQATRLALQSEIVRYTSADGITLTGLLTLPSTPGPHPAIVVLHGSERGTRNDFGRQQMSAFLASRGVAVLTYDKRGVGDSGGAYREAASESNLTLLAQDAVAGVNFLKGHPDIDGRRIGLIGSSQAGWVIPLAAQSKDVAVFVILSGPVVSVGIEDQYSAYTNDGESPGLLSSEEISEKLARLSPSGFDPVPVIQTLEQPGLWLWGDQDKSVPVPESMKNLEAMIAQGKDNFTYVILSNADHNLQQTTHGLFDEIPFSSGYPANFYATLAEWIEDHAR